MNIELIESASNEIAEYNQTEAALADLRARMANVEYDVTTTKGMAVAKADRAEVSGLRTGLEAMRKSIKAPALAHCKLIDAEAKRITDELLKLETPIDEQIKARELMIEAERAASEAAEKARISAITERIAEIRQYVELAASCRTAERIQSLQDKLAGLAIEGFEEFQEEAERVWKQAGEKVEALLTVKLEHEADQARIKTEQEAAAAQLKAEREAFAAEQAKAKAEADRLAAIAAEAAAEQAALVASDRQRLADERAKFEAEAEWVKQEKIKAEQAEAERLAAITASEQAEADQILLLADMPRCCEKAAALGVQVCPDCAEESAGYQEAMREPKTVSVHLVEQPMFVHEQAPVVTEQDAPACCAPDGLCTDACSNSPTPTLSNLNISDANLIDYVVAAVAIRYMVSTEQAAKRLAAIRDWKL